MSAPPKTCDLNTALARMGGNPQLLRQMVAFAIEDLPEYIVRLRQAVEEKNGAAMRHAAHSIRGMVVNFDATAAALAAQRVEDIAQSTSFEDAETSAQTLNHEVDRLIDALKSGCAEL